MGLGNILSCSFALFLGLCQSAMLRSKDLQMEIGFQLSSPRDLLKARLVDKNWIDLERIFNKITPVAGLFENKRTKEISFETKEKSWHHFEIAEKFGFDDDLRMFFENTFFFALIQFKSDLHQWWNAATDLLKALAEIVDVEEVHGPQKHTALHLTTIYDNVANIDLLEILLKRHGANPNVRDKHGRAALHIAVDKFYFLNQKEIIVLLLKYGADVDATDSCGLRTALMIALARGKDEFGQILLDHKANPKIRDIYGKTALHYAAQYNASFIEPLLRSGAEINATDDSLRTPLHDAVIHNNYESVWVLLHYNAKANLRDKNGKTAFLYITKIEMIALFNKADLFHQF